MSEENKQPTQPPVAKPNQMEVLPAPSEGYVLEAEKRSLEFMNPKRWQAMQVMAQAFIQSGALPSTIDNAPKMIMVFQAGYEAGLQPIEALNSFYFVKGKLTIFGELKIAQVIKAGHKLTWGECNDQKATLTITRGDNGESMTGTFTMAQAKARKLDMGVNGIKDAWLKFPENMLKYKVFDTLAKFIVPEALHGVPIKEVLEAELEEAEVKPVTGKTEAPIEAPQHKPLDQALQEKEEADKKAVEETKPAENGKLPLEPKTEGGKKMKEAMDKTKEQLKDKK